MNIVAESIIKIEKIKEEPVEEEYSWNSIAEDKHSTLQHSVKQDDIRDIKDEPVEIKEEYSWNSIAEDKHGTLQNSVKQDDIGDEEVLQLPISLLQPIEKQERDFVDEMQDPLAPSCESASGGVCSPGV
ncbi:hypothetical protein R5R35_007407 [Gryllus longicercus]|uniref:Uncharacterized protein n=1 Tax=Gryllus longicercus TaxID=2509291 RepID=A0AAN9VI13_9ORTH